MAKTSKPKKAAKTEAHLCPTCGRKLDRLLLKPKKLNRYKEELTELRQKIDAKGPEHRKAAKWSRRVARIDRRLRAHTVAAEAAH